MKTLPVLLSVSLLSVLTLPLPAAGDGKAKKKPAAEKETKEKPDPAKEESAGESAPDAGLTKEQSVLKQALTNHGRLRGFHVEVELKTPEGKATLSGDLGEGTLSLLCTDVKGVKKRRIVAGGEFYLSSDDGKTWQKGEDAEKEHTLLFNNIITAPIQLQEKLIAGAFTAKEEKLKGEEVLHLEKPASGEEAAINIWLCREKELDNLTFLRKVDLIVSGDDLELPATITYSRLAKPVKIEAPESK